ncbi:TonB-dependent receptor [Thalassotalea sp. HSM 43]|uniref:TonB-dependent receptor n=1 Tax=Thalassotalea sp. HSM 43 TaxID=2552945 RepID=UPI0010813407|nr:TonB-dependent receptor [Thalassotalea sp. HSM 43]QBY04210.1 TonB-dependent receptor [Thalassotalea sp. HSM 43]
MNKNIYKKFISKRSILALAVANAFTAQVAIAEEVDSDEAIETITVTSAKRVQNIQEVPIAVTSVSGDDLVDMQINDILSLEKAVPGLTVASFGNNPQAILRGAGAAGTTDIAVPIYHNGMYLPSSGQALAGYIDIERVEVLRGPQGTLFGRNTFGGLINVITKKPDLEDFDFGVAVTGGDYDLQKLEGFVNVPLGENVAFRLTAADEQRDPYVENVNNKKAGLKDSDYSYVRAQVLFQISDDLSVNVGTSYWEDTANGNLNWAYKSIGVPLDKDDPTRINPIDGFIDPRMGTYTGCADGDRPGGRSQAGNICNGDEYADIVGGDYTIDYDYTPDRKLEETAYYLNVSWDFAGHNLNVNAAKFEYESKNIMDAEFSGNPAWIDGTYGTRNSHQVDLTITSTHDSAFQYVLGAYLFDDTDSDNKSAYIFGSLEESWYGYAGATPETPSWAYWNSEGYGGTKSTALYGQATYSLTDKLNLTAGIRYTEDEREWTSSNTLPWDASQRLGPDLPTFDYTDREKTFGDDEHTDYRIGADYQLNDDVMVYTSFSTAYIAGAVDNVTHKLLDPQENEAFELGVKSTLLDGSLRLNSAYFFGKQEGLTTTAFIDKGDGVAVATQIPGGSIDSEGIELEGFWDVTDSLVIDFGISLDMSEYDEFNVSTGNLVVGGVQPIGVDEVDADGNGVFVMDGKNTPYTPDTTIGVGIAYTFDLGDMGTLVPYVHTYYNSGYETNRAPVFFGEQDSYTKIDWSLTWRSAEGDWSAKFWMNNASDELITTYTEILSRARVAKDYAAPRTWGLRVAYNF